MLVSTTLAEIAFEEKKSALKEKRKQNMRILPQPLLNRMFKDPSIVSYKRESGHFRQSCAFARRTKKKERERLHLGLLQQMLKNFGENCALTPIKHRWTI